MSRTAKFYSIGLMAALIAPFLLVESTPALAKVLILFTVQALFTGAGYQLGRRENERK